MKKILFLTSLLFMLAFLFSCEKAETDPKVGVLAPGQLSAPVSGTSYVLTLAQGNNEMAKFTWQAADFGFQAAVTYRLQMDKNGNDFATPTTLTSTSDLEYSITVMDMNNKALALGYIPDIATAVDFRVVAWVNDSVESLISDAITLNITPFEMVVNYPIIFVPGSYQGWNPGDSTTTIGSLKSDSKYEGYLWFETDNVEFKYTEGPSWDVNWGDDGADGSLESGGANLIAGAAGYYKLNVNLIDKTHTFARTDWGLIGSATPNGWDSDQNMTYDNANSVWTITLDLAAGEIKFRANDDWAINYGDDGGDGKLDAGGANIAIPEAGNYTITLNLSKPVYRYKVVKN